MMSTKQATKVLYVVDFAGHTMEMAGENESTLFSGSTNFQIQNQKLIDSHSRYNAVGVHVTNTEDSECFKGTIENRGYVVVEGGRDMPEDEIERMAHKALLYWASGEYPNPDYKGDGHIYDAIPKNDLDKDIWLKITGRLSDDGVKKIEEFIPDFPTVAAYIDVELKKEIPRDQVFKSASLLLGNLMEKRDLEEVSMLEKTGRSAGPKDPFIKVKYSHDLFSPN